MSTSTKEFAAFSAERLLKTTCGALDEVFGRDDLQPFVAAATSETVAALDLARERLRVLRNAIAEVHRS